MVRLIFEANIFDHVTAFAMSIGDRSGTFSATTPVGCFVRQSFQQAMVRCRQPSCQKQHHQDWFEKLHWLHRYRLRNFVQPNFPASKKLTQGWTKRLGKSFNLFQAKGTHGTRQMSSLQTTIGRVQLNLCKLRNEKSPPDKRRARFFPALYRFCRAVLLS